ncbi:ribonuclease H [Trifolium pratense]|uniref:Ribonuclease H n=1 Tax=Trifolium pratense TaxID=57577 RepID=A0A2K3MXB8_TRIPR|nr:ribonuclease H [Trifolium pratense]
MVAWTPPLDNCVKLNVDGSSLGNFGRSGYGGIIRNNVGGWLYGFSDFCGITTNLKAWLLAIVHGLSLTWSKGYTEVICEYDSKVIIDLIDQGVLNTHPYAHVVNRIRNYKNNVWFNGLRILSPALSIILSSDAIGLMRTRP